jgi:hypothetical protein
MQEPLAPLEFACPRCGGTAVELHYGPCEGCRAELRASVRGEARAAESAGFEPKLHVTPNAVALKE